MRCIVGYVGKKRSGARHHRGPAAARVSRLRLRRHRRLPAGAAPPDPPRCGQAAQPRRGHRRSRSTARTASATPAGPRTAVPRKKTPTRTAMAPGGIVVVHNGIIENYLALKRQLIEKATNSSPRPTPKSSPTWSKIFLKTAQRSRPRSKKSRSQDGRTADRRLRPGCHLRSTSPTRSSPPAWARPPSSASARTNIFVASDVPAILHHTRDIFFLDDGDVAILTPEACTLTDFNGHPVDRQVQRVTWDPIMAEKGGFKHFMLKEIYEQPRAVRDTTLGRISHDTGNVFLDEMEITEAEFKAAKNINIAACGTSWHAGLAGKFMIERLARIPVEVDYASEYRYRDPILAPTPWPCSSPSPAKPPTPSPPNAKPKRKAPRLSPSATSSGPMITREAAGTIYTHAGPEIGVASTKAFTAQLTALFCSLCTWPQVRGTITADRPRRPSRNSPAFPASSNRSCCSTDEALRRSRQGATSVPRTSSSSAAASTTPSPSKARSSSRKSPTSTPKATPPAR